MKYGIWHIRINKSSVLAFYQNKRFFLHCSLFIYILEMFHLPVPWNEGIQHNVYKAKQLKLKCALNSDPDFNSHFGWVQLHPDQSWECFPSPGLEQAPWLTGGAWVGTTPCSSSPVTLKAFWERNSALQGRKDIIWCKYNLKKPVLNKRLDKF